MNRPRSLVSAACIGSILASLASAQPSPERSIARFAPGLGPGGPERSGAAVCAWMSDRLPSFALEDGIDALRVEKVEPLPGGGARVLVRQLWHGLPVLGADARAIVSADGRLTSLIAGFEPRLDAALEPLIPDDRAGALAARAGTLAGVPLERVRLAVARRADGDHLVQEVVHRRADGERVRTLVDAVTGEVLEVDAGIAHAVGRVYPTDPRGPLEERELTGLLPTPPLRAPGFGIGDALHPAALPNTPGDFRFAPEHPSFDQVNMFWHVAHDLNDFFAPLGYAGPPDSLIVRVHFALDPEVARTSENVITFGRPIPNFCREPSLSHDIIYHELGHAVMYGFGVQPGGARREASALHEGLADYFAAAFTGDPVIGEWLYIVFPQGATRLNQPSPPWDYAHYDQVAFAGGGLSSAWANGMIIGSGLWDLRQRIGRSADSLVLESLTYLPTVPNWGQFANALFLADQDHHGGRYWTTIGEVLRGRGISGSVVAAISGPSAPRPNEPVEFRAVACCGGAPGRYQWRARRWCRGFPCEEWRDVGDTEVLRTSLAEDTELELSAVSPFGGRDTTRKFLHVRAPFLTLQGPTRVAKGASGTWNARLVAAAPWTVFIYRQWLTPGAVLEQMGWLPSVTFTAEHSFVLTAELRDVLGRTATARLQVDAVADRPPPSASDKVRLTQSAIGPRGMETRVELAEATGVRVAVYDIRGRQRILLANDRELPGERVIRWEAALLEPGIYFVRAATTSSHEAVLRFVILR